VVSGLELGGEAQERVTATPVQKEYAKAYNRLKARKQRDKISVDKWNTAIVKAFFVYSPADFELLSWQIILA
jgi:hypothetical protein